MIIKKKQIVYDALNLAMREHNFVWTVRKTFRHSFKFFLEKIMNPKFIDNRKEIKRLENEAKRKE